MRPNQSTILSQWTSSVWGKKLLAHGNHIAAPCLLWKPTSGVCRNMAFLTSPFGDFWSMIPASIVPFSQQKKVSSITSSSNLSPLNGHSLAPPSHLPYPPLPPPPTLTLQHHTYYLSNHHPTPHPGGPPHHCLRQRNLHKLHVHTRFA